MKDVSSSQDDVKYKNNINLKRKQFDNDKKWFLPSFDLGMLDLEVVN